MAIRKQRLVYNLRGPCRTGSVDIFEHLFGRGMCTASTEAIIITKLGMSKHVTGGKKPRRYSGGVQVYIDNKPYFVNPANKPKSLSNMVIPDDGPQLVDPDMKIVVPPRRDWRIVMFSRMPIKKGERVRVMMNYTLYDGPNVVEVLERYGLKPKSVYTDDDDDDGDHNEEGDE